jgi:peptidoglycan/LPS O-acetylase OafA/YrhL
LWIRKLSGNYGLALSIICLAPVFFVSEESRLMKTAGLSLLFLGFSFLLSWSVPRSPKSLPSRAIGKIGVYSYSIYLWHRAISILIGIAFGSSLLGFGIYMTLSLAIGIGMSKLIEMPILRWREKVLDARGVSCHSLRDPLHGGMSSLSAAPTTTTLEISS